MTSIKDGAFCGCRSLTKISIPNSVTSIEERAFWKCYSLKNITIPSSVVDIIGNPFYGWHGELHNESKNFIYEDHVLFSKDRTTIIAYRAKEPNYIIPDSVTTIGDGAFWECKSLISIDIPKSVTTIGRDAFCGCDSLTSINIPNSVTTIEKKAFCDCNNIPSKIKSDIIQRFGKEVFEYL